MLCLHVLTGADFPARTTGIRIYRSRVDEDGLGGTELYAGREDALVRWYGRFWRRFWYEQFTGQPSLVPMDPEPSPDRVEVLALLEHLTPLAAKLVSQAEELVRLTGRRPLPIQSLQALHQNENRARQAIVALSLQSPATASLAVALVRDTHNDDGQGLTDMAQSRLASYRRWQKRLLLVASSFRSFNNPQGVVASTQGRPLSMVRSA